MKVAIYARVSTDDRGQDPRNQLLQLREFVSKQQGWEIVNEYTDRATGKNGNRPHFRAMMQDARRHKFDILLFWDLSRITREGVFKTLFYLRQLSDAGVKYKSFQEPFLDTTGIWGEVITAVFATLAQEGSRLISERTKAGIARRMKQEGATWGRKRLRLNADRARQLQEAGMSYTAIAKRLGCSRAVIWRRLNLPAQNGW